VVKKYVTFKYLARLPSKLSLQTILIVPFVLQILVSVGLTGYFSFRNGQRAVNDVAARLLSEISLRVEQNLQTYLDTPLQINQSNSTNIELGKLDVKNFADLQRYFFHQLKQFDDISLIGFANTEKEFISAERHYSDNSLTIRVSGKSTNYELRTYTTNNQGRRLNIIPADTGKNYNPHIRPWYINPVKARGQSWGNIYPHIKGSILYLGARQPVYNKQSKLEGVLLSNINLVKIGNFLRSLKIGKTGQSFIIERSSGKLVATSSGEKPFKFISTADKPENKVTQILASDSNNITTQATTKYLEKRLNNLNVITDEQQLNLKINDQQQFVQVLPFKDNKGLDWLIVVVVPENDFMETINYNTKVTITLCIIALLIAIIFGLSVVRWITQPVIALKKSAIALKNGEWENTLEIQRSDELGELAKSFKSMAHQLQTSFLEMQGLNNALLESESRLKQFLEAVPVGVSIHDTTGQIYYANQTAKQLFGTEVLPRASGKELAEVYQVYRATTNQLYPTLQLPIIRSLAGEIVEVDDMELHQPNKVIALQVFSTPIFDNTGKIVYAIAAFIDVTQQKQAKHLLSNYNQTLHQQVTERTLELQREIEERKQIEQTLREQKEMLQRIFEIIPVMICLSDKDGKIQLLNSEHERVIGWKRAELDNVEYLITKCFPDYKQRALAIELADDGLWHDFKIKVRDGRYVDTSWIKIDLTNGAILAIGQDITERKLAEEASILEERNRMAREIHDTLAQAFTAISIHLAGALRVVENTEAVREHITIARELSQTGLAEARTSLQALRSPFLENSDLCSAINKAVKQISLGSGAEIIYQVKGTPYSFSEKIESNLLRIAQEALTNATKHSNASIILVELVYKETECILRVKDNGQGFIVNNIASSNFGIVGMKERCTNIGAELTINSKLGQGTEILLKILETWFLSR
jgi:PAS domain S-box-containing protein